MLRPYKERRRRFLISTRASERIDESASSGTVVPHLERGVEVEDVACGEPAAGAVDGEHGVAVDFVEVDVLQHGASPVREVEEIHARLVGVHAGFDGDAAHRFAPAEEQIHLVCRLLLVKKKTARNRLSPARSAVAGSAYARRSMSRVPSASTTRGQAALQVGQTSPKMPPGG